MRYRPYTAAGLSSSALTLSLAPGSSEAAAYRLVCSALESGINSFSFAAGDVGAGEALRRAVAATGRGLLILMLRLDTAGPGLEQQVRAALALTGASYLDAVMLEPGDSAAVSAEDLARLDILRASRLTHRLALKAEGRTAEACIAALDFDVLVVRYNICSGWAERNLLKMATERGMTLLGHGYYVGAEGVDVAPAPARGLARLMRRPQAKPSMAYTFLDETYGWTAHQITLGYALTEPGLASVLVEPADPAALDKLVASVERELPAGVTAQIEIARFAQLPQQSVA